MLVIFYKGISGVCGTDELDSKVACKKKVLKENHILHMKNFLYNIKRLF